MADYIIKDGVCSAGSCAASRCSEREATSCQVYDAKDIIISLFVGFDAIVVHGIVGVRSAEQFSTVVAVS